MKINFKRMSAIFASVLTCLSLSFVVFAQPILAATSDATPTPTPTQTTPSDPNNSDPTAGQTDTGGGVSSTTTTSACDGLELTGVKCGNTDDAKKSFGTIVKNIINILSIVVGAVAVIMIIVGGFRYVISGGDSNGLSGAKNTILYAIVGLVVVLFAQIIVRFVLTNAAPDASTGAGGTTTTPPGTVDTPNPPGGTTTTPPGTVDTPTH